MQGGRHSLAEGEAAFEDGTIDYLGLPAVEHRPAATCESIGMETIHERVRCLSGWLLDRLRGAAPRERAAAGPALRTGHDAGAGRHASP